MPALAASMPGPRSEPLLVLTALLGVLLAFRVAGAASSGGEWSRVAPGLEYASFGAETASSGNGDLHVLRIEPHKVSFELLLSSEQSRESRTLKDWVQEHHLAAAINASMFWEDRSTSTGYAKNFEHYNNQRIHPDFGAFFAFNPKSPDLPRVRLIDRKHEPNWRSIIERYHTVVQNYRMISAAGKSVWQPTKETYSVAAIAMDGQDRVLFLFSQAPRSIAGLNETLLSLPLGISVCMFVEGGPTAGMYIQTEAFERGWRGVSESSLWVEKPRTLFKIPNIIGIQTRR